MTDTISIHGIKMPSQSHTLISGAPGTGKTRSILRPLLREYLSKDASNPEKKVGLLLLDPKGDMLNWVRDLLTSVGREDDLIIIGEREHGFNLFSSMPLSATQYAQRLSALANSVSRVTETRGDQEYWLHQQRQLLEALIEVAQIQPREESMKIEDVVALRFALLPNLRGAFEKMKFKYHFDEAPELKQVLKDYSNLPNDTRECVLSTVANCLSVFHQPPLRELMNPRPDNHVDLIDIVEKGKCVVVSCATRSFGNSSLPLLQAIKEAFADIVLCRSEIEIETGQGYRMLNPEREILYVADECHRILRRGDEGGEMDFIDVCREFRCRAILATQSLSALQSVMGTIPANRFVALFGNFFFLNSIDPTSGDWADRLFGSSEEISQPPPLVVPARSRNEEVAWEGPRTLSRLRVGEFILRTSKGKKYRKQASWRRGKSISQSPTR